MDPVPLEGITLILLDLMDNNNSKVEAWDINLAEEEEGCLVDTLRLRRRVCMSLLAFMVKASVVSVVSSYPKMQVMEPMLRREPIHERVKLMVVVEGVRIIGLVIIGLVMVEEELERWDQEEFERVGVKRMLVLG